MKKIFAVFLGLLVLFTLFLFLSKPATNQIKTNQTCSSNPNISFLFSTKTIFNPDEHIDVPYVVVNYQGCSLSRIDYSFFNSNPRFPLFIQGDISIWNNVSKRPEFNVIFPEIKRGLPVSYNNKTLVFLNTYIPKQVFQNFLKNKDFDILYLGNDTSFFFSSNYSLSDNKTIKQYLKENNCTLYGLRTYKCNSSFFIFFNNARQLIKEAILSKRRTSENKRHTLLFPNQGPHNLYASSKFIFNDQVFLTLFLPNKTITYKLDSSKGRIDYDIENNILELTTNCTNSCHSSLYLFFEKLDSSNAKKYNLGVCGNGICKKFFNLNISNLSSGYFVLKDAYENTYSMFAYSPKKLELRQIDRKDNVYTFQLFKDSQLVDSGVVELTIKNQTIRKPISQGKLVLTASYSLSGKVPIIISFQGSKIKTNINFVHKSFFSKYFEDMLPFTPFALIILLLLNRPKQRKYAILVPDFSSQQWPEIVVSKQHIISAFNNFVKKMNWQNVALTISEVQSELCKLLSKEHGKNISISLEDLELALSKQPYVKLQNGFAILSSWLEKGQDISFPIIKRKLIDLLISHGIPFDSNNLFLHIKSKEKDVFLLPYFDSCESIVKQKLNKNSQVVLIFADKNQKQNYVRNLEDNNLFDMLSLIEFDKLKIYTLDEVERYVCN